MLLNMSSAIRDNNDIKGLEQTKKSRVQSNDKKKVSSDNMSSMPGMMYREGREEKDTRMKKKNCNTLHSALTGLITCCKGTF